MFHSYFVPTYSLHITTQLSEVQKAQPQSPERALRPQAGVPLGDVRRRLRNGVEQEPPQKVQREKALKGRQIISRQYSVTLSGLSLTSDLPGVTPPSVICKAFGLCYAGTPKIDCSI